MLIASPFLRYHFHRLAQLFRFAAMPALYPLALAGALLCIGFVLIDFTKVEISKKKISFENVIEFYARNVDVRVIEKSSKNYAKRSQNPSKTHQNYTPERILMFALIVVDLFSNSEDLKP